MPTTPAPTTEATAKLKAAQAESDALRTKPDSKPGRKVAKDQLAAKRAAKAEKAEAPEHAIIDAIVAEKAKPASRRMSPLAAEARAIKVASQGKRGPGTKLDPAEFATYVRNIRIANPAEPCNACMEFAYWVDKLAFSRKTWEAAWAAAQ